MVGNGPFTIPLDHRNRKYIGITKTKDGVPVLFKRANVDLKNLNIALKNIRVVGSNRPSRKLEERLERVRQYTDDPNILRLIDEGNQEFAEQLAFTQDELYERVRDQTTIYLIGDDPFTIPLDCWNRKYIGITRMRGGVRVHFPTSKPVDVNAHGLKFENVCFIDNSPPSSETSFEGVPTTVDELEHRTGFSTGIMFKLFDSEIDVLYHLARQSPKDIFMVCAFYLRRYERKRDVEDLKSAAYWFKKIYSR